MSVNLKGLVAKLNATCRSALEAGAGLCVTRTHYEVDIEHFLLKLTESVDSDISAIHRRFEIDPSRVTRDLARALDRMKSGNARSPALSPRIVKLLSEAWGIASLEFGEDHVRSGIVMLALLANDDLSRYALESCPQWKTISVEALRKDLFGICSKSAEDLKAMPTTAESSATEAETATDVPTPGAISRTPNLEQFTISLTMAAKQGKIDPVLGRDFEIRQIIDILTRRRQNNPILTGEAGVGKTAVVEGFALRISAGDVPAPLKDVDVRTLDLGLLQAGAGIKGEFENRLKGVISEVRGSPRPIILFIDEAHTMIGAGGAAGQSDAANLLKPALARGELRTIAATTWSEYKKYFEKDAALARRFQVIKVEEPAEPQAIGMMRSLVGTLEKHHNVKILDEAVDAAVRLSHRYIAGRQLPDKAVSVLDTACARIAIGQGSTPPSIEDTQREISLLDTEQHILEREVATGVDHSERLAQLCSLKADAQMKLAELQSRVECERTLVQKAIGLHQQIEKAISQQPAPQMAMAGAAASGPVGSADATVDVAPLRDDLLSTIKELAALQGERPLLKPFVDSQTVAEVIGGWTGIPVGKMLKDEIQTVLNLAPLLQERVIGQSHALDAISQRIRTARARIDDPRRPVGVFLLVGPSGVGKTETALALADVLYGGERNLVTINMSEYQEAHSISGLKGSPPGYVGYGEGGVLTEAVRRKPYCVVLLDEMEKAHTDVMELFYQVFDKGFMEDAEGREVDFKNTVILMTSNAGSDLLMELCGDSESRPEPEKLANALGPQLRRIFKPALLGRLLVIPYYPIDDSSMRKIIELKLKHIRRRLEENHRMQFTYSDEVVTEVMRRCTEVESGARNVDRILTGTLLPEVSSTILARMAEGGRLSRVRATIGAGGSFEYAID
ncbi:MAG TPA: type VI secretion system ATPase TssH [Bryobacteraceae bacterium]|nr:type VI secretion system ATPase TssH [Bryobacteraceae bacterium]